MIKFKCKCGQQFSVEAKYAGKKGKCPKCKEVVRIPPQDNTDITKPTPNSSAQIHASTNEHQQPEVSSGMPAWIWCLYGVTAVIIISALLYVFVFRDTWEIDNYIKLTQDISEIKKSHDSGEVEIALQKYNKLNAFVGEREFRRPELLDDYTKIQKIYEPLKNLTDDMNHFLSLEKVAKEYAASGSIKEAVKAYDDALKIIYKYRDIDKDFLSVSRMIEEAKAILENELTAIKQAEELEAYAKEMVDKGYIQYKEQWVTQEKYAILTAKGKLMVTTTYFYNDFRGNIANEAVVYAIPKEKGLQGKKLPYQLFISDMQASEINFMENIGGAFVQTGGDGKAEMRLLPGKYEVLVLMDIFPYHSSAELHKNILSKWFSSEFAESHAYLGRYSTKTAEVYPNDTTSISINLK